MLQLRNEAYQFHQINIRSHDLEDKESLVQKWCTAILKQYTSYVDWPVISLKLDDLAQLYLDRYNRMTYCDVRKSAVIEGDYITAIQVEPLTIEKSCKIPITVPQGVDKDENEAKFTYEKRGDKDRLVVWVNFEKGDSETKTITLNPPLALLNKNNKDDVEVHQEEIPDPEPLTLANDTNAEVYEEEMQDQPTPRTTSNVDNVVVNQDTTPFTSSNDAEVNQE